MRRRVASWVRSAALCMRCLSLAKALLDRIEIGAVRGQEQEPGAGAADRLADSGPFEIIQIVNDDNVAGRARRHQELLDKVGKALTLDRKSVVKGKSESVRVDMGGRGIIREKQERWIENKRNR